MAERKYNEMTVEELLVEESQLRTALFNLRVENTTKALENTSRIRDTRREVARVLTEIGRRNKAEGGGEQAA